MNVFPHIYSLTWLVGVHTPQTYPPHPLDQFLANTCKKMQITLNGHQLQHQVNKKAGLDLKCEVGSCWRWIVCK